MNDHVLCFYHDNDGDERGWSRSEHPRESRCQACRVELELRGYVILEKPIPVKTTVTREGIDRGVHAMLIAKRERYCVLDVAGHMINYESNQLVMENA